MIPNFGDLHSMSDEDWDKVGRVYTGGQTRGALISLQVLDSECPGTDATPKSSGAALQHQSRWRRLSHDLICGGSSTGRLFDGLCRNEERRPAPDEGSSNDTRTQDPRKCGLSRAHAHGLGMLLLTSERRIC